MTDWQKIRGRVERGHQVASGRASRTPYPDGTITMQIPLFKKLGLDLEGFYRGTLNVSIYPKTFEILNPKYTFRNIEWTNLHPPETFSFLSCRLIFGDFQSDCWIYYPHPETKTMHFQNPDILEIISPLVPNLEYGSIVEIEYNPLEIIIASAL
jgi:hypothetical protein